jgi:nanoRNase/pAp phosphatase (c-di-AMP/oligoRNAs hydrolase)
VKKIAIFTDCDLDGIGCYMVFKWFTNYKNLEHIICSQSNFRKTFSSWANKRDITKYDKIYIFDLDVSQKNLDLVDRDNFTIIDHHDTHVQNQDYYQHATTILQEYPSCCKLLYTLLSTKYPARELTPRQKLLVLMINDYDSYELAIKDSYNLNIVLWNYVGNREKQFERDFDNGFVGFNRSHMNMIHMNNKKVKRIISELEIYQGEVPVMGGSKDYKLYATFAHQSLNEVAHHVIDNYDCDVCIVFNMKTGRCSFRKNKERCPEVDLGKIAKNLADGGGHMYSAGGSITDSMLTLTKLLTPVK